MGLPNTIMELPSRNDFSIEYLMQEHGISRAEALFLLEQRQKELEELKEEAEKQLRQEPFIEDRMGIGRGPL